MDPMTDEKLYRKSCAPNPINGVVATLGHDRWLAYADTKLRQISMPTHILPRNTSNIGNQNNYLHSLHSTPHAKKSKSKLKSKSKHKKSKSGKHKKKTQHKLNIDDIDSNDESESLSRSQRKSSRDDTMEYKNDHNDDDGNFGSFDTGNKDQKSGQQPANAYDLMTSQLIWRD